MPDKPARVRTKRRNYQSELEDCQRYCAVMVKALTEIVNAGDLPETKLAQLRGAVDAYKDVLTSLGPKQ